ncbi:MAG: DnaJ domain-containing protein [Candidatus Hydrogenedens sp.]|nr:DnaJ domain-containing protein [Candidatus Hydrogenedens sp.]
MFGFNSIQELLVIVVLIAVLYMGGVWPAIIRGLRELRGDIPPEAPGPPSSRGDLDLCYRMLGLSSSASWEEIERAYRAKAKLHHPDRGGDGDTMRALNEAYARLKKVRKP